ncbi:MAG: iron-containing redox enzyme family protein [Parvibaculum sp.]
MSFYDRLMAETQAARDAFFSIPIVLEAAGNGVDRDLYIAYLTEAYHHVRHTCPLLAHALAHCPKEDRSYRAALLEYLDEEQGHEEWILDDIAHLGGDAEAVRRGDGDWPVRAMVSWVYYAVEFLNPYSMLGMVLVLEGTSVDIASAGADAVRKRLGMVGEERGFSYLTSHGALDREHIVFFQNLVNTVEGEENRRAIIDTANMVYALWGEMFSKLARNDEKRSERNAA